MSFWGRGSKNPGPPTSARRALPHNPVKRTHKWLNVLLSDFFNHTLSQVPFSITCFIHLKIYIYLSAMIEMICIPNCSFFKSFNIFYKIKKKNHYLFLYWHLLLTKKNWQEQKQVSDCGICHLFSIHNISWHLTQYFNITCINSVVTIVVDYRKIIAESSRSATIDS